jgi:tape measure domain-containing protein
VPDMTAQILLEAKDSASAVIGGVGSAMERLTGQTKELADATEKTTGKAEESKSAFERLKEGFESGLGFGLGIAGFRELRDVMDSTVETVVGFNAQLETMGMRLENLTGSVGASAEAIKQVKELADASPFEFKDLEAGEERLLRFNFSVDEAANLLKVAADAAAGGAGSVDLITEAFGRMNAKSELTSRGLMSLTAAGIPVFDMLAKGLDVSTAEAEKLVSKGLIPAKEGIDILQRAIEEKFPDMAAKVATGFDATVKNIKETVEFAAAEMGKPLFDALETGTRDALAWLKSPDVKGALDEFGKNVADTVHDVIEWFKQLGAAMTPDVVANLHGAWDDLREAGKLLWSMVMDFTVDLRGLSGGMAGTPGSAAESAKTFGGQVKLLAADIHDLAQSVKDSVQFLKNLGGELDAVQKAGDNVALTIHDELIRELQLLLEPLTLFIDEMHQIQNLTAEIFHVKIDIPGVAGITEFLDRLERSKSMYTQAATPGTPGTAGIGGGPGGIPNLSAADSGYIAGAGAIIPADVGGRAAFQQSFAPYAAYGAAQLGIDPSLVTAMAISESGGGNLPGNSFFGMKGSPLANGSTQQATWELENGQRVNQNAGFATFADPKTSMDAWVQFIQKNDPGAIGATSPEGFAAGLKSGGYMTDTAAHYAATLRALGANQTDGGASGGVPYGPNPTPGQAGFIGPVQTPAATSATTADIAAKLMEDSLGKFQKLMDETTKGLGTIQTRENKDFATAETKLGPEGTDAKKADLAAETKLADLTTQRQTTARLAAEALVYNRKLQDDATSHARAVEDDNILVQQQVANVAVVHQRSMEDAQTVHQEKLALEATAHQRALQDTQALLSVQVANTELLHQRALQDAQVGPSEQLQAQATTHSRTLQDTETQYQYERSLSKASSDAQRDQIKKAHDDSLENIAHQRQLEDAEIKYQQGLQATALAVQRTAQDAEIQYQNDQKSIQLNIQRAMADGESAYQKGLAATETAYQRDLQDKEVVYQRGIAAEALRRQRADQDAATAYARTLEDAAVAHKKELDDAAFVLQEAKIADDLAARKVAIAEELRLRNAAIVEEAKAAREAFQTTQDDKAKALIDSAIADLKGLNGAGDPIIAKMKSDWADVDGAIATAATDAIGHETAVQAAVGTTTAAAVGSLARTQSVAATAIATSAQDISKALGITDTDVEKFAGKWGTDWDTARDKLVNVATGVDTLADAIASLKDKTVKITLDYQGTGQPGGNGFLGNATSGGALGGIGSSGPSRSSASGTTDDISQTALADQSHRADLRNAGYQVGQNADGSYYAQRAMGGPVKAGAMYLVGEKGPEFFTPGASGHITPNSAIGGGIDYDKLAEAMVRALDKHGAFAVGVDTVHSALLQKQRRGSLGLT